MPSPPSAWHTRREAGQLSQLGRSNLQAKKVLVAGQKFYTYHRCLNIKKAAPESAAKFREETSARWHNHLADVILCFLYVVASGNLCGA